MARIGDVRIVFAESGRKMQCRNGYSNLRPSRQAYSWTQDLGDGEIQVVTFMRSGLLDELVSRHRRP